MNTENNTNANQANETFGDRQKKEKPKKAHQRTALKPQQFQSKKGIRLLYQKAKQLKLDDHSEINVENTLKKITVLLKSWHFQLLPKYSFDYFLQRCQVLGSHKVVSAHMARVRRIHKGLDTWPQTSQDQNQNQEQKPEEEQDIYNGRMLEETQEAMKMLNSFTNDNRPQKHQISFDDQDEDDEDLLRLMNEVEKKQIKNNKDESQPEQPYVPEGFQPEFQENQSD